MKIRPFEDRDYEAYVRIGNRSFPDYAWSVAEARHEDSTWTEPKYFKARWMLEDDGRPMAVLELRHQRGWFDPSRFHCDITVDPDERRKGYGSALFELAARAAREHGGNLLIGNIKESMPESVAFATKHGCVERQRSWESRLDVEAFDFAKFARAEPRVAAQRIHITTLAEEMSRDRESAIRNAFAIKDLCRRDIPSVDRPTEGSLERFVKEVDGPQIILDGFFLAVLDGDYIAVCDLWRDSENPGGLYQGLTGVHPDHRRKGIALALKLQTVKYARANGKTLIKTWNDTRNGPMLRINEAMGFVKQPAWIEIEKRL